MKDIRYNDGWLEELEAFKKTENGKLFFKKYVPSSQGRLPKVPVEIPLKLAQLYLDNFGDEIEETAAWETHLETLPHGVYPGHPDWEKRPIATPDLLDNFSHWYAMQLNEPYSPVKWQSAAIIVACKVKLGELDRVFSESSRETVLKMSSAFSS